MHRAARLLQGFTAAGVASGALHRRHTFPVAQCASSSSSSPSSSLSSRRPQSAPETDLKDKVVLITGASAGIGRACVWRFAEKGARLVLVARRADKLAELRNDLLAEFPTLHVHIVPMSVTDTDAVAALPAALPAPFRDVYCLVNNAGLALGVSPVDKNVVADAKTMLDANVLGTIAFCSAFIPGMKARGAGHVVNMGSCAGKYAYANGTVYNASKYAVHGFTEAARHDLGPTPIRVTHIAPGLVGGTEFSLVRLGDASKAQAVYAGIVALQPEDVADNVLYAVTRPAHVQVADILMYATNQSNPSGAGFVHRVGPSLGKDS